MKSQERVQMQAVKYRWRLEIINYVHWSNQANRICSYSWVLITLRLVKGDQKWIHIVEKLLFQTNDLVHYHMLLTPTKGVRYYWANLLNYNDSALVTWIVPKCSLIQTCLSGHPWTFWNQSVFLSSSCHIVATWSGFKFSTDNFFYKIFHRQKDGQTDKASTRSSAELKNI